MDNVRSHIMSVHLSKNGCNLIHLGFPFFSATVNVNFSDLRQINIIFISYSYCRRSESWFDWIVKFLFRFRFSLRLNGLNWSVVFPYLILFSCIILNYCWDKIIYPEVMLWVLGRFFCWSYLILISSARVTGFRCFFVPLQWSFTLHVDFFDFIKSCQ